MNAIEKEVLDQFKALLLKRVKLHSLVLFGSRARGDADPYSDMDVLVIVDHLDREVEDYISESAWEAGIDYGIVIVPITFSTEEWGSGPHQYSLLAMAIKEEGIPL